MSSTELFFLDLGCGYTFAKAFSYLIFPLLGLFFWLLLRKKFNRKLVKWSSLVLVTVLPFVAVFVVHPIYEGDFSNNSEAIRMTSELDELKSKRLVVISIPNCPFCYGSVGRMKELQERYPNVKIEYRVCVSDSLADNALAVYSKLSDSKFPISKAKDTKRLSAVAEMSFPTFVLVTDSKTVKWSNDNFGAGALDEVVAAFE